MFPTRALALATATGALTLGGLLVPVSPADASGPGLPADTRPMATQTTVTLTPVVVVRRNPDGSVETVSVYTAGLPSAPVEPTGNATTTPDRASGLVFFGLVFAVGALAGGAAVQVVGSRRRAAAAAADTAGAGSTSTASTTTATATTAPASTVPTSTVPTDTGASEVGASEVGAEAGARRAAPVGDLDTDVPPAAAGHATDPDTGATEAGRIRR